MQHFLGVTLRCFYFSLYFYHQRKWKICVSLWVSNVRVAASWSLSSSLYLYVTILYAEGFIVEKEIYQHFQQSRCLMREGWLQFLSSIFFKNAFFGHLLGSVWQVRQLYNTLISWLVSQWCWVKVSVPFYKRGNWVLMKWWGNEFGQQINVRAGAWIYVTWFQTPLQFTPHHSCLLPSREL